MKIDWYKWRLMLASLGIIFIGIVLKLINTGEAIIFKIFYGIGLTTIIMGSVGFAYIVTIFILAHFGYVELERREE